MRPLRVVEAAVGSLIADAFKALWKKAAVWVLLGGLASVVLVVRWFQAQAVWLQLLVLCTVLALLLRGPLSRARMPRRAAAVEEVRRALDDQVTFLYRWYDADDRLLYVGISNDLARRTGQHIADKPWMIEAVRCAATSYPNRREALEAEEHAIYREAPLYNVVHNSGPRW